MLHNIKFEINTSIISGKETLLRFLKDNPKKIQELSLIRIYTENLII